MKPDAGSAGRSHRSEIRFAVRLLPRGGADRVEGVSEEGELRVRVAAAPVGGAANAALVKILAAELDLPRGSVRLVAGATGRHKLVMVDGIAPEALTRRWPGLRL